VIKPTRAVYLFCNAADKKQLDLFKCREVTVRSVGQVGKMPGHNHRPDNQYSLLKICAQVLYTCLSYRLEFVAWRPCREI